MRILAKIEMKEAARNRRKRFADAGYLMCSHCNGRGYFNAGSKTIQECEECDGKGGVKLVKPRYKYNWKLNKAELVR